MSGIFISAAGWLGGTVRFDDGADDETYSYDTELGATAATVYQVAEDLARWFNDAARGWSGATTATLSVRSVTPYLHADLELTSAYTITISGGMDNAGWVAGSGKSRLVATTNTSGVAGQSVMSGWAKTPTDKGEVSGRASWTMAGGGGTSGSYRPRVVVVCDEAEASQMRQALRGAGSPRLAHCHDSINETWRLVALGQVRERQIGLQHMEFTPVVVG